MRKLIERFYKLSPVKRAIVVMLGLFIFSLAVTVYSFYNMASAVRMLMNNNDQPFSYMKLEQIKDRVKGPFIPERVLRAIDALDYLQNLGEKLQAKPKKTTDPDVDFSTVNQQELNELRQKIEEFNGLKWEELSLFATGQIDPFSTSPESINLRKIRYAARLMSSYLEYLKKQNSEENSAFVFSAMLKLASLTEISSPYLIGKMVSIAVGNVAIRPFARSIRGNGDIDLPKESVLDLALISSTEAAELHSILMTSLKLEIPFQNSLESEYVFFKHFSAKIYEKAPLAAYLLTTIFGNPDREYRQIINHPNDKELLMKTLNGWKHPALLIAVPNFTRAYEVYSERRAKRAVLAAELAHLAGISENVLDPFSPQAANSILSVEKDGKIRFYSVGKNGIDDKMSNDDISLYPDKTESGDPLTGNVSGN